MDFKFPLFRCQWVAKNQVRPDDDGHTTVNLKTVAYKNDPFIPANLVHQVFYIVDPKNKRRHVVMPSKRSIIGVDGVISEEDYNQIDVVTGPLCSKMKFFRNIRTFAMKHKKHYIGVVISRIICNNCMYEFLSTSAEAHLGEFMIMSHT